jgi:intracellular multiplication protein IcmE
VQGDEDKEGGAGGSLGGVAIQGSASIGSASAASAGVTGDVIKAGEVMFAVLDTGINSDEPSPIMATIVTGKLKGAKLLGEFSRVEKRVVLRFAVMSIPGVNHSISINTVAISQKTARTALADHVDNHYMMRYGTLFASAFLEGMADAIVKSGAQTTEGASGFTTTYQELSNGKLAAVGFGEVGKKYSENLSKNFTIPPTVRVYSGTGLGILFMSDLALPKT